MPQRTDLYTILMSFANKYRSPMVDIEAFIQFLAKYANHYAAERPEWKSWTGGTSSKFWAELSPLIEAGKCELHTEQGKVLILEYYAKIINRAYENLESQAAEPFPDEKALGLKIPAEQLRPVAIPAEMEEYMRRPITTDMPVLKIVFPEDRGAALFLARHIPRRVLEASVIKLQYYIENHSNKDFYAARLSTQFQGKDVMIRDMLSALERKPYDCVPHIEEAGEFACLFWPFFGAQIKSELSKKNELTTSDLAALQAVFFIDFFIGHFRSLAAAEKEREMASQEIEARMEKQPWLYTYKDILGFNSAGGKSFAEVLGQDTLRELIKEKTTKVAEGSNVQITMPPLIIYRNSSDEQVFISKAKVFPLATKLLLETRPQVQKKVSARWSRLLRTFRKEPSMEYDKEFDRILTDYVAKMSPNLSMLLEDPKTYLIQAELERSQDGLLQYPRLFDERGALQPMSTLLPLNRKTLLADTKIMLPLWFSIPFIAAIMGFFARLKANKKKARVEGEEETEDKNESGPGPSSVAMTTDRALKNAAIQFQKENIPQGQTADQFLASLEKRWRKILDSDSQKQMTSDVQGLIKKKLQRMLAVRTRKNIDSQIITELADGILFETPSFMDLDSTSQIKLYISVYISKILQG